MEPGPRRRRLAAIAFVTACLVSLTSLGYMIAVGVTIASEGTEPGLQMGIETMWIPMLGTALVSLQMRVLYGDREPLLWRSEVGRYNVVLSGMTCEYRMSKAALRRKIERAQRQSPLTGATVTA